MTHWHEPPTRKDTAWSLENDGRISNLGLNQQKTSGASLLAERYMQEWSYTGNPRRGARACPVAAVSSEKPIPHKTI